MFNPAGVHANTLARYGKSAADMKAVVTVYRVKGEPLTSIQDSDPIVPIPGIGPVPAGEIMPDTLGTRIVVLYPEPWSFFLLRHKIDKVLAALTRAPESSAQPNQP